MQFLYKPCKKTQNRLNIMKYRIYTRILNAFKRSLNESKWSNWTFVNVKFSLLNMKYKTGVSITRCYKYTFLRGKKYLITNRCLVYLFPVSFSISVFHFKRNMYFDTALITYSEEGHVWDFLEKLHSSWSIFSLP